MMKHSLRSPRLPLILSIILIVFSGTIVTTHPQFVGENVPDSFSLCEEAVDGTGGERDECEASDIRFDLNSATGSQFGFSVAAGFLNGDSRVDLAVGDPVQNKVYIFYGRRSAQGSYGLLADQLERGVSPEDQADVVLFRDPAVPGQVKFFGYSLAISRRQAAAGCGDDEEAAALLIGSPGDPSAGPNAPGTVFHLAPGALCETPADPPQTQIVDPETLGQKFNAVDAYFPGVIESQEMICRTKSKDLKKLSIKIARDIFTDMNITKGLEAIDRYKPKLDDIADVFLQSFSIYLDKYKSSGNPLGSRGKRRRT